MVKGKLSKKGKSSRRGPSIGNTAARAGAAAKRRLARKRREARTDPAKLKRAAEAAARIRSAAKKAQSSGPATVQAKRVTVLKKKRRKTTARPAAPQPVERHVHYDPPPEAPVVTQSVNVQVNETKKSRCCCCLPTMILMLCPVAALVWITVTLA